MIAIDLITGFLGAGKTTFILKALEEFNKRDYKTVYVVNEFGQRGYDGDIVKNESYNTFELVNGCICCTLKDDVTLLLLEIAEKVAPDRIFFEPSGVFILPEFLDILQDIRLSSQYQMDNTLCVIDCRNLKKMRIVSGSFAYSQIGGSAKLLLNKTEGMEDKLDEVLCEVTAINPNALIFTDKDNAYEVLTAKCTQQVQIEKNPSILHDQYKSFTVFMDKSMSRQEYETFVNALNQGEYGNIVRAKGFLSIEDKLHSFSYVLGDIECRPYGREEEKRIVFIEDRNKPNKVKVTIKRDEKKE